MGLSDAYSDDVIGRADRFGFQNFCSPGSIIGVGEKLHKVLGQVDLGTFDSGERSLPFGLLVTVLSKIRYSKTSDQGLLSLQYRQVFSRTDKGGIL